MPARRPKPRARDNPGRRPRNTHWPARLASIGAIRFARRSSNFAEAVRFYRELVGLPLYETFESSFGSNGAIFGLPSWNLTLEIVESVDAVAADHHDQLCLYFPDQQAGTERSTDCGPRAPNLSTNTRIGRQWAPSPTATRTAAKSCSRPSSTA